MLSRTGTSVSSGGPKPPWASRAGTRRKRAEQGGEDESAARSFGSALPGRLVVSMAATVAQARGLANVAAVAGYGCKLTPRPSARHAWRAAARRRCRIGAERRRADVVGGRPGSFSGRVTDSGRRVPRHGLGQQRAARRHTAAKDDSLHGGDERDRRCELAEIAGDDRAARVIRPAAPRASRPSVRGSPARSPALRGSRDETGTRPRKSRSRGSRRTGRCPISACMSRSRRGSRGTTAPPMPVPTVT